MAILPKEIYRLNIIPIKIPSKKVTHCIIPFIRNIQNRGRVNSDCFQVIKVKANQCLLEAGKRGEWKMTTTLKGMGSSLVKIEVMVAGHCKCTKCH